MLPCISKLGWVSVRSAQRNQFRMHGPAVRSNPIPTALTRFLRLAHQFAHRAKLNARHMNRRLNGEIMKPVLVRLGIATSMATLALLAFNTLPASASPSSCSWGNEGSFSWAYCGSGTGKYQAWAQCKPRYFWITNWYTAYGPMQSPGTTSIASCDGNHQVASYGITYS
jgi:hypothetical protein